MTREEQEKVRTILAPFAKRAINAVVDQVEAAIKVAAPDDKHMHALSTLVEVASLTLGMALLVAGANNRKTITEAVLDRADRELQRALGNDMLGLPKITTPGTGTIN